MPTQAVGQSTVTASAFGATALRTHAVGQGAVTTSAFSASPGEEHGIGLATVTTTAFGVSILQTKAVATWPASLPQSILLQDLEVGFPGPTAIRVPMDSGPAFQRQRFTASTTPVQGSVWVSLTEYTTLVDFWQNTLAGGSLAFNWKHPITEEAVEMQFLAGQPPNAVARAGTDVLVELRLEILP